MVCPLWAWWEEGGKLEVGKKTDKPKSVEVKGAGVPEFASGGLVSPSAKEEAGGLRSPFQPEHPHNMAGFARRQVRYTAPIVAQPLQSVLSTCRARGPMFSAGLKHYSPPQSQMGLNEQEFQAQNELP